MLIAFYSEGSGLIPIFVTDVKIKKVRMLSVRQQLNII